MLNYQFTKNWMKDTLQKMSQSLEKEMTSLLSTAHKKSQSLALEET